MSGLSRYRGLKLKGTFEVPCIISVIWEIRIICDLDNLFHLSLSDGNQLEKVI